MTRIRVLKVAVLASVLFAAQGLGQGSASSDEEPRRAVEAWVRRDIEEAIRFVRSPPNLRIELTFESRVPGTPEQEAELARSMAAMRAAIEGKPDHPLRAEYARLSREAPGASNLAEMTVWCGTLGGRVVYRASTTHLTDVQTQFEPKIDFGRNGRVTWNILGADSKLYLQDERNDGSDFSEYCGALNPVYHVMTGWFFDGFPPMVPEKIRAERDGDDWRVEVRTSTRQRQFKITWDERAQRGFVAGCELLSPERPSFGMSRSLGDLGEVAGVRPAASNRLEYQYKSPDREVRRVTIARVRSVMEISEEELAQAAELPATEAGSTDIARGTLSITHVADMRGGVSSPTSHAWTPEFRAGLVAIGSGVTRGQSGERGTGAAVAKGDFKVWLIGIVGLGVVAGLWVVWKLRTFHVRSSP